MNTQETNLFWIQIGWKRYSLGETQQNLMSLNGKILEMKKNTRNNK